MTEITIRFNILNNKEKEFLDSLNEADRNGHVLHILGYREDDAINLQARPVLQQFAAAMEEKLRKNDHKTTWRDKPVEALFKLLLLEIEEFKVSFEFFTVGEARPELVDIANFALIVWDRLGLMTQDKERQ